MNLVGPIAPSEATSCTKRFTCRVSYAEMVSLSECIYRVTHIPRRGIDAVATGQHRMLSWNTLQPAGAGAHGNVHKTNGFRLQQLVGLRFGLGPHSVRVAVAVSLVRPWPFLL